MFIQLKHLSGILMHLLLYICVNGITLISTTWCQKWDAKMAISGSPPEKFSYIQKT